MLSLPTDYAYKNAWFNMPNRRQNNTLFAYQQLEQTSHVTIDADKNPKLEEVRVEMADMKVESRPVELITSVGSCVAICLHDSINKCGGLAHIMLPTSANALQERLPFKFANTAIPALAKAIWGISRKNNCLSAKIAGGANMFANLGTNHLDIGAKNIKAVKAALIEHKIRLAGEDVGGVYGRRVTFNVASGIASVKCFNGEIKKL